MDCGERVIVLPVLRDLNHASNSMGDLRTSEVLHERKRHIGSLS